LALWRNISIEIPATIQGAVVSNY